jgi:hypothetical protein
MLNHVNADSGIRRRSQTFRDLVLDIEDDKIWFSDARDDSRSAPISGLKNRLTRARKSAKSRKPVSASS